MRWYDTIDDAGPPRPAAADPGEVARIRHDLRTPLNAIIGYSEMLLEDVGTEARSTIGPDLERVRQGGLNLLALVNEIVRAAPDASPAVGLDEIRRLTRERLRPPLSGVIASTNGLLEKAGSEELSDAVPDLRRIRDAGLKLLSMIEPDFLVPAEASASVDGDSLPVPAEVLPFARLAADAAPGDIAALTRNGDADLLVVDDHETNRDILSRYLQRHGHRVSTASGGRQALGLLSGQPFDLVLLDIVMPDLNGYQVLQQMKSDPALSQVPVILISALDETHGKVQAFKAGGVDYVTKPFQADEVIARVENQLKISRLQKDLARQNQELIRKNDELTQAQKRTDLVFSALAEALPGTVLDGKYRLDEKIGTGGFGAVFRGEHLGLNLPVAIKVFRPLPGNDTPDALERFRREGVAASRIKHPNVVAIHDNGISANGIAYLVMELLNGHTLASELAFSGRMSPGRAAEIMVPVCDTLAEFHSVGIVHRDIKPENIYLHRDHGAEVVKLLDFGLSKIWEPRGDASQAQTTMTLGDALIGTLTYMAPERLLNHPYDGRSDVYSVGVVIYRMLCGKAPFHSDESAKYLMAVLQLTEDPPPLSEHNPDLPPGLCSLVARTLSRNPDNRPDARELAGLLREIVPR